MKSKICLAFVLIVCSSLLCVLFLPTAAAQRAKRTPTPSDYPIPSPTPVVGNSCCGTKPPLKGIPKYSSSTYATFTGQIAVATQQGTNVPNSAVVVIMDLKNQTTAPRGARWTTPSTNYYSHSAWNLTNLGDVFGLTLDKNGNIYVAATTIYGTNKLGSSSVTPGTGGHGDIYKLDANTGTPIRFVQTDSTAHTYVTGSNKMPNTGPGLGNIHYSCDYDTIYAANFEDGMIYSIDASTGTFKSSWNHGHNLPSALPATAAAPAIEDTDVIANNPTAPWTQLGRRPVAVQTYNGRLYYSIAWTYGGGNTNTRPPNNHPNEIWSVWLDGSGNFIGPARLEITLPNFGTMTVGTSPPPAVAMTSNPVFDISFGPAGQMLLAQRTMKAGFTSDAHWSRVLEYTWNSSSWVQATLNKYSIGVLGNGGTNAAGGCDYDWGSPGFMWATGDALHFAANDFIYGLQGTPTSGSPLDVTNSILIDTDNDVATDDKYYQGDVEIPCPGETQTAECSAVAKEITCKKDGSGYSVIVTVTNNTGQPVTSVLLTPPPGSNYTVSPANAGPLANHASINVPVTITGGQPGEKACFTVTFMTREGCQCTIEVCVVLPDCCATLNNDATKIVCNKDGTYTYTTTITNNSGSPKQFIYLYPPPGVTMTLDHFTMTQPGGLPQGGVFQTPPIIIKGAKPGEFCFDISLHNAGMEGCCISPRHCITLPDCRKGPIPDDR